METDQNEMVRKIIANKKNLIKGTNQIKTYYFLLFSLF